MTVSAPSLRVTNCTRYRFRYSACDRCAQACPHEAITLTDSGADMEPNRCHNCGLCISACHTGAWSSSSFKIIDALRQAIRQPQWTIACAPSGAAADTVAPCLGAVDGVTLAYLGKRRIPVTLLGSWHCETCHHGKTGANQLALHLETYRVLEAAALSPGAETRSPAWIAPVLGENPSKDAGKPGKHETFAPARRQLFRRLIGRGIDEVILANDKPERPPIPEEAIRAGPYLLSEQRELLQIVCQQKDDRPFIVPLHEGLPMLELTLEPGCTVCEACFRVCPTGAIQIEENPDSWSLQFQADRCVNCQVCLEVCQPRVLDAAASFDARPEQPPKVLLAMNKQRCQRCDRHFVSARLEQTCPICRDDEDAFAAIFG